MLTSRIIWHFEVHFHINHQVFWYHQIRCLRYSSVTVLHSNILACYLADPPPWRSVKGNFQTLKDGLKIAPAEIIWWASQQCSFWSLTVMLWKRLHTEHSISISLSSKSSNFKTTSRREIRFTFEQSCMKHHGCTFPVMRTFMPIFNNKQRSFSVSVKIHYLTTLTQHIYWTSICLNQAISPQNISFLSQIGIPKYLCWNSL